MALQTALISQGGYNWVPVLQSVSVTNQSAPSNSYISSITHCKARCSSQLALTPAWPALLQAGIITVSAH